MPEIKDIIDFAQQRKPVEIMQSFNDIMRERVAASITDRRIEVGAKMFNPDMDDETLERIKASAVQSQAADEEVPDNESDENLNQDSEDESDEDPDISDEDLLNLSDEEWAELGIDEWDFEEDSDQKEEE
jgi:hypothetical protein